MLTLAFTSLLALGAVASPHSAGRHMSLHHKKALAQRESNFTITVENNCDYTLPVATYTINELFVMTQESDRYDIEPGCNANISTAYSATGMRLSPNANWTLAEQWNDQPLFEWGYSAFGSVEGTAYDISLMNFAAPGMKVVPANSECDVKCCTPSDCPADQGWTSETDGDENSAADTGCYHGMTDFLVTFCPDNTLTL